VYLKLGFNSLRVYREYRKEKKERELIGGRFMMERESKIV
jgi:hypothetical protein